MTGASQSLYRKYRPRSFEEDELVGQEAVARTLRNAIQTGRVAHAYLFCGPRGTGKTSTARLLAKAVNCEHADPARRPCHDCRACRAIGLGENRSLDIIEIDAASNRGIDDIRDLRERINFSPSELTYKFYIIDEVHQLSEAAANALLKTLEEPPRHAKFVLATTDPQKMLETIVSRCQVFRFRRIPLDRMVARLRAVCAAEGLVADDEALTLMARQATGSLRDALGLLDKLSAYGDERITTALAQQALGIQGDERAVALVDAVLNGDLPAALTTVVAVVDDGIEPRLFTQQVVEYLRELLLRLAGGASPAAGLAPLREAAQIRQAGQTSLAVVADLVQRLSTIDYALERGAYAALPLELALVEAHLGRSGVATAQPAMEQAERPAPATRPRPPARAAGGEVTATARRPEPVREPGSETGPAVPVPAPVDASVVGEALAPAPSSMADAPAVGDEATHGGDSEDLQRLWQLLNRDMRAYHRQIHALLREAVPVIITGETLVIAASYPFHQERLREESRRQVIEETIERYAGRHYQLVCVLADEAERYRAAAAPSLSTHESAVSPPASNIKPDDGLPARPTAAPPRPATPVASAPPAEATTRPTDPVVDDDERRVRAAANLFHARPVS